MSDAVSRWREPPGGVMFELSEGYGKILALLDRAAAMRRVVADVPSIAGLDMAWVGEPGGEDQIVLGHTINSRTLGVNGLIVPIGCGLGGQVLRSRRPMWVSDYTTAANITRDFLPQVEDEGVKGMIAVPMVYEGQLLGVLYGASRHQAEYGDRVTQALEQAAGQAAAAAVVAERARHAAEVAAYEERRRLAVDLHDTVGAMLFTIGAGIRKLVDQLPSDDAIRTRLGYIEDQARQASAALRGSLYALSASPEEVALGVALRGDCRAFEERSGVIARLITVTEIPPLTPPRIRALVDATREALVNIEKHAHARSVVVSVFAASDGVAVTIADDGVGLPRDPQETPGLGLAAMSERLSRVGGRVRVAQNDDGGVTIQTWVPA